MATITAIYENGVFRPLGPVDLPERTEVEFDPLPATRQPEATDPEFAHLPPGLAETYAILSRTYEGGPTDSAARHDEMHR